MMLLKQYQTYLNHLFYKAFLLYKYFLKSEPSIVNFYNNELSSDFEMDITNNLENLESFIENYTFIEKYLINKNLKLVTDLLK